MTEPIVLEFDVAAPPDHAFTVWTERAEMWWPRSHTISQDPDLDVVFEPHVGGRIYERATDGSEHDWGEVLVWDPPQRIAYLWHLFFARDEATEVEISFAPSGTATRVTISQRGFAALGEQGPPRRARTEMAWQQIAPLFQEAAAVD